MELPYQLVQVLVINMSCLVGEIPAHCDNDIVGAVVLGLGLGKLQKRIDLMEVGRGTQTRYKTNAQTNAIKHNTKDLIKHPIII